MQHYAEHPPTSQLCYLDASKVETPAGVLSELNVLTADGEPLGSIAGVVIEATARRVRYFEVQSSRWFRRRRYLLEIDELAHLDPERKALRLRPDCDMQDGADLDAGALRRFGDDDLVSAMFASRAA